MNLSKKLKERFCMDCKLPIKLYDEPYFMDRIQLMDPWYDTIRKFDIFQKSVLDVFANEQEYFEEYNRVKDAAINYIKGTSAYEQFNSEDMNIYSVPAAFRNLKSKEIFKPSNVSKMFLSIDMKKANFSALRNYSVGIFGGARTWEDFLRKFTDVEHIIQSKYIRQVILGNCNPKRHITYEKHIMACLLSTILKAYGADPDMLIESIEFFSNDEIVFDVERLDLELLKKTIDDIVSTKSIPFHVELFTLHNIEGTSAYFKKFVGENDSEIPVEFKCLDNYTLPFVLRRFSGQEITENDKVFLFEGRLAKFID